MNNRQPNIIISTRVGSFRKYLLNAPFGPTNRRHPSFTGELEKARRFYDEAEALRLVSRCIDAGTRQYEIETVATAPT